jgi:ADP-heptose:LPS heptosyltransferase
MYFYNNYNKKTKYMKTGIFLSYKGLGSNLLHLSYCHQISKKFGPVSLITLNDKVGKVLKYDANFNEVVHLKNYYKKFIDIFKLAKFLKSLNLNQIFIFYPSFRYYLACRIAGIGKIYQYPLLKKKNLHLVQAAKKFIQKSLKIENCPTETRILVDKNNLGIKKINNLKTITLGIGSSGPSTKWGYKNFTTLINILSSKYDLNFYLLCGPDEESGIEQITQNIKNKNCISLSNKNVDEILHYINLSDLYIGNDSFGQHIASQLNKPSFIFLLDTPKAYSDYSKNQFRIIPPKTDISKITHDSNLDPNLITVEMVINKIEKFI